MRVEPDKREDLMERPRRWLPQAGRPRGTAHRGRTSTPGRYRPARGGRPPRVRDARPVAVR